MIHQCYCMTYDANGEGPFVGKCFYSCNPPNRLAEGTSNVIAIPYNASNVSLNDIFCRFWHRTGLMCGECKQGYAPPVYSFDLSCIECNPEVNILKYIIAALLGPTVFLLMILLLRIKITSGKLNTFIFVSQILSSPPVVRTVLYTLEFSDYPWAINIYVKLISSFYGIWNLDFFRPFISSICFSSLSTRQALGMDCIIAAYPLVLLIVLYVFIHLHSQNYRVVVFLWKPFHVCFTRCRQIWEIRNSVVDTFIAFVILSYSKILNVLFDVTYPIELYEPSDSDRHGPKYGTYYEASDNLFDKTKVGYFLLMTVTFFVFNLLPIILLCLYPTRCGRSCLGRGINRSSLQIFSDAFQGYYKDGTDGTRDLRFYPAVYFIARIVFFSIFSVTLTLYGFMAMTVFLMIIPLLVLVLQPYKKQFAKYNRFDAAMILILATITLSCTNASLVSKIQPSTTARDITLATVAIFVHIPLLYMAILLVQWIIQRRKSVSGTYKALINPDQ